MTKYRVAQVVVTASSVLALLLLWSMLWWVGCDSPTQSLYKPNDLASQVVKELAERERAWQREEISRQVKAEVEKKRADWNQQDEHVQAAAEIDAMALELNMLAPSELQELKTKQYETAKALTIETPLRSLRDAMEIIKAIDEGRIPHVRSSKARTMMNDKCECCGLNIYNFGMGPNWVSHDAAAEVIHKLREEIKRLEADLSVHLGSPVWPEQERRDDE